jgi:phosphatidate cytidylyltransferase
VTTLNQRGGDAADEAAPGAVAAPAARNFRQRVISAAILVPLAIVTAYIGGWLFLLVCLIGAGAILWEWTSLVLRSPDLRVLLPGTAALLSALALVGESEAGAATGMIVIGAMLAGGVLAAFPRSYPAPNPPFWAAAGVLYAGLGMLGPTLLRGDEEWGFAALLFLFAIVWTTDICAYFAGRAAGGPLLWPKISPNKTWAGAIGGLAGGVAAGMLVAYASGGGGPAVTGVLALVLSVLAQGGDLFESAVKRRFGVKDAGSLIPGHGGVMDRVDGFVFAALAALLIGILHEGTAAPARGLLVW